MNPNFTTMTKSELKAYLLEHRNNLEAFYALMDKINAEPEPKFYPPEEAADLCVFLERSPTVE
jgi:hypothetical protein